MLSYSPSIPILSRVFIINDIEFVKFLFCIYWHDHMIFILHLSVAGISHWLIYRCLIALLSFSNNSALCRWGLWSLEKLLTQGHSSRQVGNLEFEPIPHPGDSTTCGLSACVISLWEWSLHHGCKLSTGCWPYLNRFY